MFWEKWSDLTGREVTPSGKAGLALLRAALAEPAAPRPTAAGPAYKIGQVVQVYSKSAKGWVDAKVISIENGLVTVNYSGPDGTMMSKRLTETDLSDLRPITRENLDARNERMSRL